MYAYAQSAPTVFVDVTGLQATIPLVKPSSPEAKYGANIKNYDNEISVLAHHSSTPGHVVDERSGKGKPMSMTDLAKEIQNYSDYSPDKTVRLIVCRGGEGPNSAAEQLAKALGSNPVVASEDRVQLKNDGTHTLFNDDNNELHCIFRTEIPMRVTIKRAPPFESPALLRLMLILAMLGGGGCANAQKSGETSMQFHFDGSDKEWLHESFDPIIERFDDDSESIFVVKAPATCGLRVGMGSFKIDGSELVLRYDLYAEGELVMSKCEFTSRFTFKHLPKKVEKVVFEPIER